MALPREHRSVDEAIRDLQIRTARLERARGAIPVARSRVTKVEFYTEIYMSTTGIYVGSQHLDFAPAVFVEEPFPVFTRKSTVVSTVTVNALSFDVAGGVYTGMTVGIVGSQSAVGTILVKVEGVGRVFS